MALGRKQRDIENSYMLIDKSADLNIVEKIYDIASNLDKGIGVERNNKDEMIRKAQALSQYEVLYKQFPDSERAPEAKYRVGMIQWKSLGDIKAAKNTFSTLITDYPRSSWAQEARNAYATMDEDLQVERAQADETMRELSSSGRS